MIRTAFAVCLFLLGVTYGFLESMTGSRMNKPSLRTDNGLVESGLTWWWNAKMSQTDSSQTTADMFYYPENMQERMARMLDGGYHYWWWQNILLTFPNGRVLNEQRPSPQAASTTTTTTTTTTTQAPTTTTADDYPPWPDTCSWTNSDALGPFYAPFVPFQKSNRICEERNINQDRLDVSGYVFVRLRDSQDCTALVPQVNAKVEVWMAGTNGQYSQSCVGYIETDARGYFAFTSSMPAYYTGRPKHVHYQVTTAQNLKLVTQMYFASDPHRGRRADLTVQENIISATHRSVQFNIILRDTP